MKDREIVERIIEQGNCRGIDCRKCPFSTVGLTCRPMQRAHQWLFDHPKKDKLYKKIRQLENRVNRLEKKEEPVSLMGDVRGDVATAEFLKYGKVNLTREECEELISALEEPDETKPTDPEIIGNVMRWNGRDYLEAKYIPATAHPQTMTGVSGRLWIKFGDIKITDELACMRKKNQPIWVMAADYKYSENQLAQLIAAKHSLNHLYSVILPQDNMVVFNWCRLATIDDLKKAGIK